MVRKRFLTAIIATRIGLHLQPFTCNGDVSISERFVTGKEKQTNNPNEYFAQVTLCKSVHSSSTVRGPCTPALT
jgi:hypothetical protein